MPRGLHRVNDGWGKILFRAGAVSKVKLIVPSVLPPTLRKNREGWGSHGVVMSAEGWASLPRLTDGRGRPSPH